MNADFLIISLVLALAITMGLIDYFGHKISGGLAAENRDKILSFSSGALISLLFLILVPDLIIQNSANILFFYMLIGFLVMHFVEKFIYQHEFNKQKLLTDLKVTHIIGFGLDNFLVGLIIATILESLWEITLMNEFIIETILLSTPLFLQMLTSSISLDSIDISLNDKFSKIVLSILPIAGAILGIILEIEELFTSYILSFVLGVLFYMIIRDVIPRDKEGSSLLFLFGNFLSILLWLIRIIL